MVNAPHSGAQPSVEKKTSRLLVLRPGAIGDTLLTFPVLEMLRAQYEHITLVGNAAVLPLARAAGVVDETQDYTAARWSALFAESGIHDPELLRLLRSVQRAICWLRDPDGVVERNLRAAGVPVITIAPGRPPAGRQIHESAYLAETLGLALDPATYRGLSLPVAAPNIMSASPVGSAPPTASGLAGNFPAGSAPIGKSQALGAPMLAIHPGAGSVAKCWPAAHFAAVIAHAWQYGQRVLLLAGPADHERLAEVLRRLPASPDEERLSFLIDAPLLDVARALQSCSAYLGNDSGITHLAAMLGVPTLALFGPSDPAIWHPLGPAVRIVHEEPLERLSVAAVLANLV